MTYLTRTGTILLACGIFLSSGCATNASTAQKTTGGRHISSTITVPDCWTGFPVGSRGKYDLWLKITALTPTELDSLFSGLMRDWNQHALGGASFPTYNGDGVVIIRIDALDLGKQEFNRNHFADYQDDSKIANNKSDAEAGLAKLLDKIGAENVTKLLCLPTGIHAQ